MCFVWFIYFYLKKDEDECPKVAPSHKNTPITKNSSASKRESSKAALVSLVQQVTDHVFMKYEERKVDEQ